MSMIFFDMRTIPETCSSGVTELERRGDASIDTFASCLHLGVGILVHRIRSLKSNAVGFRHVLG